MGRDPSFSAWSKMSDGPKMGAAQPKGTKRDFANMQNKKPATKGKKKKSTWDMK